MIIKSANTDDKAKEWLYVFWVKILRGHWTSKSGKVSTDGVTLIFS